VGSIPTRRISFLGDNMKIELIYDLDMYQWVLNPIKDKLEERGHQVFKSKTKSDPKKPKCDGSIAIQDVAYDKSEPSSPRFFINHGSSASKGWDLNFPIDYFLSPSPYWTRRATEKKSENNRQYKVLGNFGYPRMDVLLQAQKQKDFTRQLLRELFDVPIDKPLITCFPTYKKPESTKSWIRNFNYKDLVKKIAEQYVVIVCPHQMETTKEFDGILEHDWQVYRQYDKNRLLLFGASDVIVSDTSGAAYEACGLDIPVVLMDGRNKIETEYQTVDLGITATLDNIIEKIDSQLHNPEEFNNQRRFWADYILGPCDGFASERIVMVLEEICPLVQ
jgi:CDP-glycerol glycerophosphotransferase (TagB/SpsB family)